ncbi:DUF1476 domain-containing protein [Salinarimonas sp.]|uniref:DUF1476 domain-containing protein n=1 Tax=Salinarimonas sp. TaxID=2766526 RepID=UPI00391A6E29
MTTFDEREAAFEKKFAHDEELRFKSMARRNRMLGLWAAERLGKSADEAEDYARAVIRADLAEPGDEDVYRKVRGDLPASISDADIRAKMTELLAVAVREVEGERK